uniref:Uncharacterized LOC114467212 n=1 Tax=Gouania willdenowi TaxID=441366 RepID=A0A8C5I282_GOUWI
MEDFEYSVDISDRDWQCFFEECEECNMLPPSLAGLDDSGMSDMDDTGSVLLKEAERCELTKPPIDSPPECESSPVELYLSKHGFGGMESILSGSEEDLHLQSINMYFENLKGFTEAEQHDRPDRDRDGKSRDAGPVEKFSDDGQQTIGSTLPKNIPKSKYLPVRGKEAAVYNESTSNVNTIDTDISSNSNFTFNNSQLQTNKSGASNSFERKTVNEEQNKTLQSKSHDLLDSPICSDSMLHTSNVEIHKPLDEEKQLGLLIGQSAIGKNCYSDLTDDPDRMCNFKEREEKMTHIAQSDMSSMSKAAGHEFSPSASIRRRRRRKKRLSEEEQVCERQSWIQLSESDEESLRGALNQRFSEDVTIFHLKRTQKDQELEFFPDAAIGRFIQSVSPALHLCEELKVGQKDLASNDGSERDDRVKFSPQSTTHLQPYSELQIKELTKNGYLSNKSDVTRANQKEGLLLATRVNHCFDSHKNKETLMCQTAEVKSINLGTTPESYDPLLVDAVQNVKLSTAMSGLAPEAGNHGREEDTVCHKDAEPQQQLNTHRVSSSTEKIAFIPAVHGGITSPALETKPEQLPNRINPLSDSVLKYSLMHGDNVSPKQSSLPSVNGNKLHDSPLSITQDDINENDQNQHQVSQKSTPIKSNYKESPMSEGFLKSLSDITCVSSLCSLDTQSALSLSNETISDLSASFCSSVSDRECEIQEEKLPEPEEPQSYGSGGADDAVPASKAQCEPGKGTSSVFAMSSFWKEMEKLTINDILALRTTSSTVSPASLPPLQEGKETDSGFFQIDETRQHQTFKNATRAETDLRFVLHDSSAINHPRESEPLSARQSVDVYSENLPLMSVVDTPSPLFLLKPEQGSKKLPKNISTHNLCSLATESFVYQQKRKSLQDFNDEVVQQECFEEGFVQKQNPNATTFASSLTDIFQFLFGGKPSDPTHSGTDDVSIVNTEGNSVAETYDHFFSEFDTESFFYPLISDEEKAKDEQIPIFSCSRSANKILQFPEAYDYFFPSSSSDESSTESDEEDVCSPLRVVTRFSRKASSTNICSDVYDNFFTDRDLKQNLFWKTTFSFRSINFTASTTPKQTSNAVSCVPVRRSRGSHPRLAAQLNALGNPETLFPDPLLYHWEEKVTRQLAQRPFAFEDLQTSVLNPVLLANFSALSAIRYLRKYVKVEASSSETEYPHHALTEF